MDAREEKRQAHKKLSAFLLPRNVRVLRAVNSICLGRGVLRDSSSGVDCEFMYVLCCTYLREFGVFDWTCKVPVRNAHC